jgi:hypothetical protein
MPEGTLQRLLEIEAGEPPIVSVYLDMRPHATGENPALRADLVTLKDRLREIEKTFWPRGPAFDSFQADAARIEQFIVGEFSTETHGLAIFACSGRGMFETLETGTPFETQVTVAPAPNLFQLARLLDDQETSLVALVDTNTTRLFVTRWGHLEEVDGPNDKNTKFYRKRAMGGWSQARYQRRIDNFRADFAKEAAAAIEQLVTEEGVVRVLLAGDEVAIPLLRAALSPQVSALLHDEVLRLDMRTPPDDIKRQIAPLLAQAEQEADHALADQLLAAVRSSGLGVAGLEATHQALEFGQVDTLLLAQEAELDEETRSDLVRRAAQTSASVEIVAGHEGLQHVGGVGALLRYRFDGQVAAVGQHR